MHNLFLVDEKSFCGCCCCCRGSFEKKLLRITSEKYIYINGHNHIILTDSFLLFCNINLVRLCDIVLFSHISQAYNIFSAILLYS